MEEKDILARINSFPRWHYQFDLKGHLTPIHDTRWVNRHLRRKEYFFDPLVELLGGSLAGKRVLDLGCNAGFWSLAAVENGCDFVLGIDGRSMHIEQADFVFEVRQVEKCRYRFIEGDVFEVDFKEFGSFDVVLFLGLMYHICKPVGLMEKIAEVSTDLLVIDTSLSMASGPFLEIIHENMDDPRRSIDYELVLRPTKQAVFEIAQQFGYDVRMLEPRFQDHTGAQDYRRGERRAFLCAKKADLTHLVVTEEPPSLGTRSSIAVDASKKDLWARRQESAAGTTEVGTQFKFNIIYTPGTVKYLRLFVLSLLSWSDCSFRLIANGCPSEETRLLQEFCRHSPRLEFLALPSKELLGHGQALSYLQSLERSDHFCFMDSDILATGPFLEVHAPFVNQYAGVFSCSPIWLQYKEGVLPQTFQKMTGLFHRSDKGICLGGTYWAIYDNRILSQLIESTGISFARYKWSDIPRHHQDQLAEMGLKKELYDAGKVLNLLLAAQGERMAFRESPCLHHIGGISISTVPKPTWLSPSQLRKRRWRRRIKRVPWPIVRRPLMALAGVRHGNALQIGVERRLGPRKFATCRHFLQVLDALFEDRPLPAVPEMAEAEVEQRIRQTTRSIVALYEEHGEQLI